MTSAPPSIGRFTVPRLAAAAFWLAGAVAAAQQPEPLPLPPVAEQPATAAPQGDVIVEVRIEGNHATEVSKLPKLVTRAGQIFDPQAIEEDVRTLHRSRKFVDVHPKYVRVAEGIVVVFQVVERPMLRYVKYVGNERVTTRTLRKKAEIDVGDAMDPYVVEEARRRIESHYHEKGFEGARVTTVEGDKQGDKGAVFLIDEGRNRKALWTSFVGNTIASDARLLTQIKSKPGVLWMFGGNVDRSVIDQDVETLTAYYRSLGFFQAKVGREVEVVHEGGRDWTHITFVVNEGPRYTVRNVSFLGNSKFKTEFLERDLELKGGEHFNQAKMDKDLNLIRDIYGGRGFVFADIRADPRFLEEPGQLDLVYNVSEGQRYRVGKINVRIRGEHPHTRHSTVLNRLSLRPGDILDIRKLRDDERRLKSSSLFLADASKGEGPKIVFSKPDPDDTRVAREPEPARPPGFRGQSPDGDDAVLDLVLEAEWNDADVQAVHEPAPAPAPRTPAAAPTRPATATDRPVWRGQSPAYPTAPVVQQPFVAQPMAQPQGAFQVPVVQQPVVQQPVAGWPAPQQPVMQQPASPWGGAALAPAAPNAIDYGRAVAPPSQVYTAQQQLAPGQMPPLQPAVGGGMPFGATPVAQADPNQPPAFQQPGVLPDFAGDPGQVYPGNEPYVIVDVDARRRRRAG
jgi:outer membrane protein insertion porin family